MQPQPYVRAYGLNRLVSALSADGPRCPSANADSSECLVVYIISSTFSNGFRLSHRHLFRSRHSQGNRWQPPRRNRQPTSAKLIRRALLARKRYAATLSTWQVTKSKCIANPHLIVTTRRRNRSSGATTLLHLCILCPSVVAAC